MQSSKTIIPVLNEKLCNFFTILSFVDTKKFFIADIPDAKRYFFFLHNQGDLKKAEKSMIKNDRKTLRKKSERLVFLVVLDC